MRIILSRKGFDSSAGGAPSPIVAGRPVSLPIPAGAFSKTSYRTLGLAPLVETATHGRISGAALCHHDPMFVEGDCLFGQCGAAQSHLANRGVGEGDVFLFFGLFREPGERPHHRIFGYLRVAQLLPVAAMDTRLRKQLAELGHPHALGMHGANDTIYRGPGAVAARAHPALRLSVAQGPPSLWQVPPWMGETGLSYHDRASRWRSDGTLQSVARGQEFVADIGARKGPRAWLDRMIALIDEA